MLLLQISPFYLQSKMINFTMAYWFLWVHHHLKGEGCHPPAPINRSPSIGDLLRQIDGPGIWQNHQVNRAIYFSTKTTKTDNHVPKSETPTSPPLAAVKSFGPPPPKLQPARQGRERLFFFFLYSSLHGHGSKSCTPSEHPNPD